MSSAQDLLASEFATMPDLVRAHARETPHHLALAEGTTSISYADLDALVDRIAAGLQRDGLGSGGCVALCASSSINYVAVFVAALRAGGIACPLAPSSTPEALAGMVRDCGASHLFCDDAAMQALADADLPCLRHRIALEGADGADLQDWLPSAGSRPTPVVIEPDQAFNIIYSSGTTGAPKGIVQAHGMRWGHVRRGQAMGYDRTSVTLASTPLYSNTTLVSVIPTLVRGGTVILMRKFEVRRFLELSEAHRVTHAMLVPVQYRRLMDFPDFDRFDLSSYRMKTCTSAPFAADLKAEVLRRWPGGLVEIYGMTEGGGSCLLQAHVFPDKLHTVGRPAEGHDIRIIDDAGKELPRGETGEIVGRSGSMMLGYHNLPAKTAEAVWTSPEGLRFIRTGDIGRFDPDGFLILGDRKKDMIISGGFNIYPSDLEAELLRHDAVKECAVVGVASREWGETPAAFVVLRPEASIEAEVLRQWVNARLGKTQRIAFLTFVESLPRSPIGKVLKRELRDGFTPPTATSPGSV
jgi:long-chain acyl-CoA synthetase